MSGLHDILFATLNTSYFGIAVHQYLMSLGCLLAGFILRHVCVNFLDKFAKAADASETHLDDILLHILRKPLPLAVAAVGIYFAIHNLPKPDNIQTFIQMAFKSATVLFALWVCLRIVDEVFTEWAKHAKTTPGGFDDQLVPILQKTLKVFLIIVGGILFLQNMGYSVGGLLAGFGLGGAAVAMASQDSLSNLFGSIVVVFDRPFRVGDWIEVDGKEGTVEEIGLRTTKMRTFANSVMTIPNSKFTTSVINNWSQMNKRKKDIGGEEIALNENETVLGGYAAVADVGWFVYVQQPLATAYVAASKMRKQILNILLWVITITVLLSLAIAAHITLPIRELTLVAERLTVGAFEDLPELTLTNDEIGDL